MIIFSIPYLRVTSELGHPTHDPSIVSVTIPLASSKSLYTTSPPSSYTSGLMRVSIISLIICTASLSSSLIFVSSLSGSSVKSGKSPVNYSVISEKIWGFNSFQSDSSVLETEM